MQMNERMTRQVNDRNTKKKQELSELSTHVQANTKSSVKECMRNENKALRERGRERDNETHTDSGACHLDDRVRRESRILC